MKRSWKNGWIDDFCTMWRTQLSEIFLRKIIPLHTPMQSLSSTWTISEWTRDKDDKAHLLGRTRKNYKKSESSYSVSDSEPHRVPICSIGKIWFCLFFFFEKLAQTLCQSEYSLCPQKSMLLSQEMEEKERVKGKVKEVEWENLEVWKWWVWWGRLEKTRI